MSGRERLDKKLKQALKEVYCAPEPVRKTAFLKQHRQELASIQAKRVCRRNAADRG